MLHQKLVKSVLNKHKQRDSWFLDEYSVNAYEGCSCNCQYCYIRGSKYGENMEDGLVAKSNAPEVLEKQLASRARKNQYGFVAVGSATDAYIHQESDLSLTGRLLKILLRYRFPVFISTKRDLILRDLPLLKEIDQNAILPVDLKTALGRGAILSVSVSTMNEKTSQTLEPGAIPPSARMELVQKLKMEGFLVGVNAIPVLPFISDTEEEMERIIMSARQHEADYVLVGGLTIFGTGAADSKTLYYKFLDRFSPGLKTRYEALYGNRFYTSHSYERILKERADKLCLKHGIRNQIIRTDVC